ncbi:MAG TPA: class II fumarate hydratase [Stellaceae bacterium]|jgi:fumarate hydratase class II|nr:class II fumarate hydratase [Stellaceae bacterium]
MAKTRRERDSLGEIEVPADRLWGAQTQRSLENFPIGRGRFVWGRPVIRSFGLLKKAAARANGALGELSPEKVELIARAAEEIVSGKHDGEFPLVVFQTGSGTQSNMNANEVIANRAAVLAGGKPGNHAAIHPNDDVNRSQSSNDAFPAVMHIAAVEAIERELLPALAELREALDARGRALADLVIIGRTHLMDATPLTLGQLFSGWVAQLDQAAAGVRAALDGLYELPLGGTAVGTGLNAPAKFGALTAQYIAEETGRPFRQSGNLFAVGSAHDAMVAASAAMRTLAGALMKIANDIRWYASGPRAGLGEFSLPENEPGSSIMPGKVNPTQNEALTMVAAQVFGNDLTVAFAGSQGNFQLNAYKPIIMHNVLESAELLAEGCRSFAQRCVAGIEANKARIRAHLEDSLMLVTALSPHIGYEKSAEIALYAHRHDTTLREAALKLGHITEAEFDAWVRPEAMTKPDGAE